MYQITNEPIDPQAVLESVRSPMAGAIVLFLGVARQFTAGRETRALDYQCYSQMAEQKLAELEAEARRRWPLTAVTLVHRVGHLQIQDISVAVAVSAAHRQDAFQAGQWLIDTLKEVVPIWKQEHWADGTSEWVHPGINRPKE